MASKGAVTTTVSYSRNKLPDRNSGLTLPFEHKLARTGVRQGDFLVRPRGSTGNFARGVACFPRSAWKEALGNTLEELSVVLERADQLGLDLEQAEAEYLAKLSAACEVVVVSADSKSATNVSIVENGNIQYTSTMTIPPGALMRFSIPSMKKRIAMVRSGDDLDGVRGYFGAPMFEVIPTTQASAAARIHQEVGAFLASRNKRAQIDAYRAGNGIEGSFGMQFVFARITDALFTFAILHKLMGTGTVPLTGAAKTKVAGGAVDVRGQYAPDLDRDASAGMLMVDTTNVGEPLAPMRICLYAARNAIETARNGSAIGDVQNRNNPDELAAAMAEYIGLQESTIFENGERISDEGLDILCQEIMKPYTSATPASGTDYMVASSTVQHSIIGAHFDNSGKFLQDLGVNEANGAIFTDSTSPIGRFSLTSQAEGGASLAHCLYTRGAASTFAAKAQASVSASSVGSGQSHTIAVRIIGH